MGARHKNNAIILTTIQGERGVAGYPGPNGQEVYTGTGDPNTLGLVLPDYSADPASTQRGSETLYYQDTVTGDVWAMSYTNSLPQSRWIKTSINLKGETGETGSTAIDKIDINLMRDGRMLVIEDTTSSGSAVVCKLIFPGTDVAPDFTNVQVISRISRNTSATLTVTAQDGTVVATGNIGGDSYTIDTIAGSFPAGLSIFTVTVDVLKVNNLDTVSPPPVIDLGYLTIR